MQAIIEIDLHGKNQYQAKIAIDAALRRVRPGVMRLRIIHGYHGGTTLRDMVREEYAAHPKIRRIETRLGDGITDLVLREL